MSTPSPLQPQSQGALEEASSPKSRVRITVLTILALHVVVIGGLLLQGCDKRPPRTGAATNTISSLPPLPEATNANYFSSFPGDSTAAGGAGAAPGAGAPAGGGAAAPAGGGGLAGLGDPAAGRAPAPAPGAGAGAAGSPATAGGAAAPGGLGGLASLPPASSLPPAAPAPSGGGTEYVIRQHDTIGALAKKFHVTEKAILEANPQVKPKNLKVNDKITIPPPSAAPAAAASAAAGSPAAPAAADSAAPAATGAGEVYLVKQGDTLAKIAKKFGVSVKQLRAVNNIKGDRIVPKQKLTIPAKAAASAAPAPAAPARTGGQI